MPFFTWSDSLVTGHEEIDYQHQRLFDIANQVADNKNESGNQRMLLELLLEQLIQYTDYHFRTEEKLMMEKKYPNFAAHKAIHDKLRATVIDFKKKFSSGTSEVSDELLQFLKEWLFQHIQHEDTKIAKFL